MFVNGNRYLPENIVEHDCISTSEKYNDVESITTNGVTYTHNSDIADRSLYVPYETVIKNENVNVNSG